MIDSIVQLSHEVNNALKRSGLLELCLHEDELDFLKELVAFLRPFKDFTDMFSSSMPTLSVVPMMKLKIRKLCHPTANDDPKIKEIKAAVLRKLDSRFAVTDHVKLHQLLDPETKDLIPRAEATQIIEQTLNDAIDRNFIILG